MADVIYAEPYALKGGVYYYGKTIEYSVAAYASRRLGFYHGVAGSTNENFINLLNAMVNYGTLAQKYFNYNVDNLMSDVVSAGKHATLTHIEALAPTCTEAGHAEYWQCECGQLFADADGKTTLDAIPTLAPLGHDLVTDTCTHCTRCNYRKPSDGLVYTLNADGASYSVTGIGTATDTFIVIAPEYNSLPVTAIGANAFYNQSQVIGVETPASIDFVGEYAFCGCKLGEIDFKGNLSTWVNIEKIKDRFFNLHSLGNLYINNLIVKDITISNSTSIRESAFSHCLSLQRATISEEISLIDHSAFAYCKNLDSISLPVTITTINSSAFYLCENLSTVDYSGNIDSWCSISFTSNPLDYGANLFFNGKKVEEIILPNNIIEIKPWFAKCNSIVKVVLPVNATIICGSAFATCKNLKYVTMGDHITEIQRQAFYECSQLETIHLSQNLERIGSDAFRDCQRLTEITLYDNIKYIGSNAFDRCNLKRLNYYGNINSWYNVTFDYMYSNPMSSSSSNGCDLYINDAPLTNLIFPEGLTKIQKWFINCTTIESVTIPTSATAIGYSAFQGCSNLTNIFIPDNVSTIEGQAFLKCISLTKLSLPEKLTSIGTDAFSGCINLTNLTIPNSVTSIGASAFSNCEKLTNLTIPNNITSIEYHTFYNCRNLTSIIISDSVNSIKSEAFYNCSNLKRIDFDGTMSEWKAIAKGNSWNFFTGNYTVYCTDGKLDKNDKPITD